MTDSQELLHDRRERGRERGKEAMRKNRIRKHEEQGARSSCEIPRLRRNYMGPLEEKGYYSLRSKAVRSFAEFLALKHESRILGHSSNPACGFSMMEQVRLCAVWPMEDWLGTFRTTLRVGPLSKNPTLVL